MNWKIVTAFVGGAVLASGVLIMSVKPKAAPNPAPVAKLTVTPEAPAVPQATSVQPPPAADPPAAQTPAPAPEKPSPMPPARQRAEQQHASIPAPVVMPPSADPPAVNPQMTEPINKDRPYNDAKQADVPPQEEPAYVPPPPPAPARAPAPPPRESVIIPNDPEPRPQRGPGPNRVILLAGTVLPVRIAETISSAHNQKGDTFMATLDQPLVIDGFVIADRGARVEGEVVDSVAPGRGKNSTRLEIRLVKLSTTDGQHIPIRTDTFHRDGHADNGKDVATVAAGAAIGAAIGGAAGSGKGAGIGAAVGGAAGLADVLLTKSKALEIPVESRISFRMAEAVAITERLN